MSFDDQNLPYYASAFASRPAKNCRTYLTILDHGVLADPFGKYPEHEDAVMYTRQG